MDSDLHFWDTGLSFLAEEVSFLSSVCGKQCGDHQCPFPGAVLHVWLVKRGIQAKQSHTAASSPHSLAPDLSSTSRLSSVTLHPQARLLGSVWFIAHWLQGKAIITGSYKNSRTCQFDSTYQNGSASGQSVGISLTTLKPREPPTQDHRYWGGSHLHPSP